jgi:glycosyltransferase involved in cell wall biosynthesis
MRNGRKNIAILGTVGIPAIYGGFETLAVNLTQFHQANALPSELVVYCSAKSYSARPDSHLGARLRYIGLNANGVSSIPYDIVSLFSAVWHRSDVILLLGVSGASALPLVRLLSRARIVTNIDGIEWKREKWKGLARWFLRFSERMAVRYSHEVIADNAGIAEHVAKSYGRDCHVIAYGGDHALQTPIKPYDGPPLPPRYALTLCRIEPENNVAMVLGAFAAKPEMPLVFVGNWNNSDFGRELRQRYAALPHLHLLDPIYDIGVLRTLRGNAALYVHGHSAGGTNPSLVEMMHFGVAILAYDCIFNRCTTEEKARFFKDAAALRDALDSLDAGEAARIGEDMRRIAKARYTWDAVGRAYFDILLGERPALKKASTQPAEVSG